MTSFPGQVYLERIRETLWSSSTGSSGAAALIGAGFSRNADRLSRSALPFPVWKDVARAFCTQLGRPETDADVTPSIRLGSEYQAVFGRQQLDDFIATLIPQKGYAPGQAHHLLLSLPWQDLFTTNYDTLLEDARSGVLDRAYSMVSRIEDLPGQSQPRIVKLHGSFPSVRPFIFTEEDFRTYPRRFAPLVNLVQQSLMEHTLVALGFSGDDPNFAAWSGWVRDELGPYAPNIYLCGWYDFPAARQKYFSDRGVIPVDLAPLFPASHYPDPGARHALSTLWLLESLRSAEPHHPLDWPHRRAKKPTLRSRTNLPIPHSLPRPPPFMTLSVQNSSLGFACIAAGGSSVKAILAGWSAPPACASRCGASSRWSCEGWGVPSTSPASPTCPRRWTCWPAPNWLGRSTGCRCP